MSYNIKNQSNENNKHVNDYCHLMEGFLNSSLDLLCITNSNGKILKINNSCEKIIGYKADEVKNTSIFDYIHRDDIDATVDEYKKLQDGVMRKAEKRLICKDGRCKIFEYILSLFGKYCFIIAFDITEQKETENTLRESEKRFKMLVNNLSDALWVIDGNGRFIDVNISACISTGYSREELLNLSVFDLDPTITLEKFNSLHGQAIESGFAVYHGIHKRKNGKMFDVEVNIGIIEFNGLPYALCTTRDISDKKRSEKALRESEHKFRTVVDQSSDIILVCNLSGVIEEFNKAAYKNLGYNSEEILNMKIHDLIPERSREYVDDNLRKTDDEEVIIMTEVFKRKNGTTFIGDIRTRLIDFDNKNHILAVIRDITENKKNEEKIKYLSFHDKLTGLYNRTFLEEEIKRLDTNRQLPISFIMGDVNGLKLTNDIFGHQEGDRLLKKLADIIKSTCRTEDLVARWGGDEFVMILPCTSEKRAEEICRTIKDRCNECSSFVGKDIIEPSISLGYATKNSSNEDIMDTLKKAEDSMYKRKLLESRSTHSSLVSSMRSTLYEKSQETEEHAVRLKNICRKVGKAMELSDELLNELELFSMLHDIGKIAVDAQILNKVETLTNEEWEIIKRHPVTGYRIAKSVPELNCIADFILCHHERWDGCGYPQGLAGEDIPLLSRILAIVDSYDAMTEDRPYRKSMSKESAINELTINSGKQFDPNIVKIFLEQLNN